MNPLLNTALLGTAKQPYQPTQDPIALQNTWAQLSNSPSPEAQFYAYSAYYHAHHSAGANAPTLPQTHTWQTIAPAPVPDQAHTPNLAITQLLQHWLDQSRHALILYALKQLEQHHYTLPQALLPDFIQNWQKNLTPALLGTYGQWLLQQTATTPIETPTPDDWSILPHAQRKHWLVQQRQANPDYAREQLQTIWASTPANQRQEYLEICQTNLSHTDIEFLTQTLKDRSKNIRELAQQLLLKLPDSPLAQQHLNWLRERLHFDTNQWHKTEVPYSNELKNAGIDELSPHKNESDSDYQLRQIIQRISLTQWSSLLNTDLAETIHILINHRPSTSLNRADWVQTINHPDFTYAMLRHSGIITKTSKDPAQNGLRYLAGDLENAFNSLPIEYKEQLLAEYPDLNLSSYYNIWEQQPLNETWGEYYSQFILNYLMNNKHYQGVNPENIAVYLANTPKIHAIINRLPKLIEQHEGNNWKQQNYQTLFDSYMARVKLDDFIQQG